MYSDCAAGRRQGDRARQRSTWKTAHCDCADQDRENKDQEHSRPQFKIRNSIKIFKN